MQKGRREESGEGGEKQSVGLEFFSHNVTLLITALEHPHGDSGPADCDLGSTSVFRTSTQKSGLVRKHV